MVQTRRGRRQVQRQYRLLLLLFVAGIAVILALLVHLFTGTPAEAHAGAAAQPAEMQTVHNSEPDNYTAVSMTAADQTRGTLVLVNNQNHWDFPENPDLVPLYDYQTAVYSLRSTDMLVSRELAEALNAMLEDFYAATEIGDLNIVSAYRTYEEQEALLETALANEGEEHARRFTAQPGGSEHHTGLAIDFQIYRGGASYRFDGTGDYGWIYDHCAEYGFVRRYLPEKEAYTGIGGESWHFRYVGKPHAALMTELDLCLEEYLELISTYLWDGEHLVADGYEVYYCAGDTVYVPKDAVYTVSGLNGKGYIVTVKT